MHKWNLGFTNMSEASRGIRVSHIRCGDLSLTFSECSKEEHKPSFLILQKHCPLKSFLVFPCTNNCFPNILFSLLIFWFNPSPKDFLHLWNRKKKKKTTEKKLRVIKTEFGSPKIYVETHPIPGNWTLFRDTVFQDVIKIVRAGPNQYDWCPCKKGEWTEGHVIKERHQRAAALAKDSQGPQDLHRITKR